MSRAEDRALEKYPLMSEDDKEGLEALKYIGMECDSTSEFNEVQEAKQAYFIEGYHKAEKDLELNWEDVEKIIKIHTDIYLDFFINDNACKVDTKEYYQEVLKRFKDLKGR